MHVERRTRRSVEFTSLREAIADLVLDGNVLAMEGFTHLIPFAAGHEVIRQGRKNLTLIRMTPDLIYDQKADRKGNVLIHGIIGIQKEAVLASKRAIVTVEEMVDDLHAPMNSCVLPHWCLSRVCVVPGGAFPSYAHGYYRRDNAFCKAWDAIAKDRDRFRQWIDRKSTRLNSSHV